MTAKGGVYDIDLPRLTSLNLTAIPLTEVDQIISSAPLQHLDIGTVTLIKSDIVTESKTPTFIHRFGETLESLTFSYRSGGSGPSICPSLCRG